MKYQMIYLFLFIILTIYFIIT